MRIIRTALLVLVAGLISIVAQSPVAAQTYKPSESNLKAREWFQDARFGMFIHWGVYSVPSDGEWYMEQKHVPVVEYEKFAPQFNPTQFNAAEIVALAKSAGMKYITITSKHHDGFAMFGTKQNKWNIVDATPSCFSIIRSSTGITPIISRWVAQGIPPGVPRAGTSIAISNSWMRSSRSS
jgi:hypothetical protein